MKKALTLLLVIFFAVSISAQEEYEVGESAFNITSQEKEDISVAYQQLMLKLGSLEQSFGELGGGSEALQVTIENAMERVSSNLILTVIIVQLCINAGTLGIVLWFKAKKRL